MNYQEYLQTEHWQLLRAEVFRIHGKRCSICKTHRMLQIHHWRYRETFFDSVPGDLFPLCDPCHQMVHRHGTHTLPKKTLKAHYRKMAPRDLDRPRKRKFIKPQKSRQERAAEALALLRKWGSQQ